MFWLTKVDRARAKQVTGRKADVYKRQLLHRLNWSQNAPTGCDILKIATRGSARLLGRDDIGYLRCV